MWNWACVLNKVSAWFSFYSFFGCVVWGYLKTDLDFWKQLAFFVVGAIWNADKSKAFIASEET